MQLKIIIGNSSNPQNGRFTKAASYNVFLFDLTLCFLWSYVEACSASDVSHGLCVCTVSITVTPMPCPLPTAGRL